MTIRCALAGATTAGVVVAAVGNPSVVHAARDNGTALAATVTGFASWDVLDAPADVVGLAAVRLGVLVVVTGVLCAVAGRARSRSATWLAAWAAVMAAGAVAGAAGYAYQEAVILDGQTVATSYADGLVLAANAGAAFGLWTGWFVGLVAALAAATQRIEQPAAGGDRRPGAAPPPPWWAPTPGPAGTAVHPGPTAYPPGGLDRTVGGGPASAPPSAPPVAATSEMSTASGDPHPSDPEATRAVGFPPGRDTASEGGETTGEMPAADDAAAQQTPASGAPAPDDGPPDESDRQAAGPADDGSEVAAPPPEGLTRAEATVETREDDATRQADGS